MNVGYGILKFIVTVIKEKKMCESDETINSYKIWLDHNKGREST